MPIDVLVPPEQLMAAAADGRFTKHALATMLTARARRAFLEACGRVESRYTEACRAKGDPCLEAGCSVEGERCLQPLIAAGNDYYKACGGEFVRLFVDAGNRDPSWRMALSHCEV